jgi:hypothetical protein
MVTDILIYSIGMGGVSKEGEVNTVNIVDNFFSLTLTRTSSKIATKRRRFWNERKRISLSDEIKDISGSE